MPLQDLWTHLEELGVQPKQQHPVFGRPEDELAAMLQKRCVPWQCTSVSAGLGCLMGSGLCGR